jgi:hypothetical protein
MARWLLLIIVVAIAVSPEMAFLYLSKKRAASSESQKKREAGYQSARLAYSRNLRPGLKRKEVESYLQAKDVGFRQMCCIEERGAFADLVEIGQEDAPWYCSENYVYIAFEFSTTELSPVLNPSDVDILKRVSIFRQLGGCL